MSSLSGRTFGRYVLGEEIGRGGMSRVHRAMDTVLKRPVALKILAPQLSLDPEFMERFEREAQMVAKMRHPNIVTIFDIGAVETDGAMGKIHYIAMEYIAGRTLQDLIDERGRLGLEYTVAILDPVARALDHAHAQGAVHRDVKPQNVMVDTDGRVVLMDFGIAQGPAGASKERLTRTGTFMGTPEYLSPEQASSQPVDGRSDLYSLGVVAYELITGSTPFSGPPPQLIIAHVYNEPPAPTTLDPSLPREIDGVFRQALAKLPDERFGKAIALLNALRSIAQARGLAIPNQDELAVLATPRGSSAGKATIAMAPQRPPTPQISGDMPTSRGSYPVPTPPPGATPARPAQRPPAPTVPPQPARAQTQPPRPQTGRQGTQVMPPSYVSPEDFAPPPPGSGRYARGDDYGPPPGRRYDRSRYRDDENPLQRWALPIIVGLIFVLLAFVGGRALFQRTAPTPTPDDGVGLVGTGVMLTRVPTETPEPGEPTEEPTFVPTPEPGEPTFTEVPPSETPEPEPPTNTPEPEVPTNTAEPPRATVELPTNTIELPTNTVEPPTNTVVPPTATAEPTPTALPQESRQLYYLSDGQLLQVQGSGQPTVVAALPAEAQPPLDLSSGGTALAYSVDEGGTRQIAIYDLEVDEQRVLTSEGANYAPSWSPDGERLLYVSDRDGDEEIYLYDISRDEEQPLTNNDAADVDPSWAPDGTSIVFASNRDGEWNIWTLNLRNGNTKALLEMPEGTAAVVGQPRLSRDGKQLVYTAAVDDQSTTNLYLAAADGKSPIQLTSNTDESELWPSWSPDDKWIAYQAAVPGQAGQVQLIQATRARTEPPIILSGSEWPFWTW